MKTILREYMDYSDRDTIHQLSLLSEANQNQFLVSLTSKLYDKIKEKTTKIDFSSVEMSRGDITKIQNYQSMIECLTLIRRIVLEYKQDPASVDEVLKANQNLIDRMRMFKKAFAIGSSLPILVYNSTALALVESTSFLITVCIEYVKDPAVETVQMALDIAAYNKTKQNLLFNTLREFNKSCADRSLDNALNMVMSQAVVNRESADISFNKEANIEKDHPFITDEDLQSGNLSVIHDEDEKSLQEGNFGTMLSFAATKTLLWILKKLIPVVRAISYWFFLNKQKVSDWYIDQADMLELNAMELRYNNTLPENEKRAIIAEQLKKAERFRKRGNEMSIDYMVAKKSSEKLISDEAKKFKADEVQDDSNISYASIFEAEMNNDLGELVFETPFEPANIDQRIESFEEGFFKKKQRNHKTVNIAPKKQEDIKIMKYSASKVSGSKFDYLYDTEAMCAEGLTNADKNETHKQFAEYISKNWTDVDHNKEIKFYYCKGKDLNDYYHLTDDNKYSNDLGIFFIDCKALGPNGYNHKGSFRWFADVVDNNARIEIRKNNPHYKNYHSLYGDDWFYSTI